MPVQPPALFAAAGAAVALEIDLGVCPLRVPATSMLSSVMLDLGRIDMHAQLSIRLDNRSSVAWDTREAGVGGYASRLNNRWCRPPCDVLFDVKDRVEVIQTLQQFR